MATAQMELPKIELARKLTPGIQTVESRNPLLPPSDQGGLLVSNLKAEFLTPDKMPDPRPPRVLFAGLRDPRLRMVLPIPLDVTVEESNVVVCWKAVDEFGVGQTLSGALDDFSSALRELYHRLNSSDELGPDLAKTSTTLSRHIVPR